MRRNCAKKSKFEKQKAKTTEEKDTRSESPEVFVAATEISAEGQDMKKWLVDS